MHQIIVGEETDFVIEREAIAFEVEHGGREDQGIARVEEVDDQLIGVGMRLGIIDDVVAHQERADIGIDALLTRDIHEGGGVIEQLTQFGCEGVAFLDALLGEEAPTIGEFANILERLIHSTFGHDERSGVQRQAAIGLEEVFEIAEPVLLIGLVFLGLLLPILEQLQEVDLPSQTDGMERSEQTDGARGAVGLLDIEQHGVDVLHLQGLGFGHLLFAQLTEPVGIVGDVLLERADVGGQVEGGTYTGAIAGRIADEREERLTRLAKAVGDDDILIELSEIRFFQLDIGGVGTDFGVDLAKVVLVLQEDLLQEDEFLG